jgi:hypothetical protein
MTKEMFLRILNEAQARVDNDSLPLDVLSGHAPR